MDYGLLNFNVQAARGELDESSGWANLAHVNVDAVKVGGAKNFFEAKAQVQVHEKRNMEEIKKEQEEVRKQREEAAKKKAAFKERAAMFSGN
jgi:hypothetical protein